MAFFSFMEVFDILVMTALIGFLFMDILANRNLPFMERFKTAAIALAPAIIIHELAHKFTAMAFGLEAVFHAFYANTTTMFLGMFAILAKLSNLGFIFLVPGYVEICPGDLLCQQTLLANPLWGAIIAFAGPLIHLIFWLGSAEIIRRKEKTLSDKWFNFLVLNKKINKFLFILNMLPIPGIDGWSVYSNLIAAF